jgi:hypothetical protein
MPIIPNNGSLEPAQYGSMRCQSPVPTRIRRRIHYQVRIEPSTSTVIEYSNPSMGTGHHVPRQA